MEEQNLFKLIELSMHRLKNSCKDLKKEYDTVENLIYNSSLNSELKGSLLEEVGKLDEVYAIMLSDGRNYLDEEDIAYINKAIDKILEIIKT